MWINVNSQLSFYSVADRFHLLAADIHSALTDWDTNCTIMLGWGLLLVIQRQSMNHRDVSSGKGYLDSSLFSWQSCIYLLCHYTGQRYENSYLLLRTLHCSKLNLVYQTAHYHLHELPKKRYPLESYYISRITYEGFLYDSRRLYIHTIFIRCKWHITGHFQCEQCTMTFHYITVLVIYKRKMLQDLLHYYNKHNLFTLQAGQAQTAH